MNEKKNIKKPFFHKYILVLNIKLLFDNEISNTFD